MEKKTHQQAAQAFETVWNKGIYKGFSKGTTGADSTPFLNQFSKLVHETNKHAKVAELGAGSGDHATRLAKEGFNVVAVESSTTACALMKERLRDSKTQYSVVEKNLFDFVNSQLPNTFDGIYANSVCHFLTSEERKDLYAKTFKIQKDNGILAISFKCVGDALQKRSTLSSNTDAGPVSEGEDKVKRLFVANAKPLEDEIRQAGYKMLELIHWSVPDYNIQGEAGVFIGLMAKKLSGHSHANKG